VKVAESVGGYGEQVTDPEKLQDALKRGGEPSHVPFARPLKFRAQGCNRVANPVLLFPIRRTSDVPPIGNIAKSI